MKKFLVFIILFVALSGCSLKNNTGNDIVNNAKEENGKLAASLNETNDNNGLIDTKSGVKIKFTDEYQFETDGSINFGPKVKETVLPEGMTGEQFKIAQSEATQIFKYKFKPTNFRPVNEIQNNPELVQKELVTIGSWPVVRYSSLGAICDDAKLEVVGQNNNYIFSVNDSCSDINTNQASLDYLKEIINSMKLE